MLFGVRISTAIIEPLRGCSLNAPPCGDGPVIARDNLMDIPTVISARIAANQIAMLINMKGVMECAPVRHKVNANQPAYFKPVFHPIIDWIGIASRGTLPGLPA
ncbi:hypothetical protein CYR55_04625 [Chimaeribacter californicus]|uniref:Uncharacterized protein n=1 Tax=Chimaeribacter californicus TaxID=2060067 RepID=A0A2N5EF77_9GAMM|nr:hypothetical protein CYR55_04625 [Chimaeribacter californicus]